ncbi:hypothetical protein HNQ96_000837 [Aminobacter lissarensis]|uniref:Uncharacterized protein n=1 Tax=Aminobacter carboxidus TaxID=376165 RepID=A0A8E1WCA6_9HYPH|nr:DUF6522 family protein [Aminobacter lissarensis]MBB6464990.1 hypothetical protein [Aminobacter lissarensis]
MKLDLDQTGSNILEPQRHSVEANELRRRMRLGLVTSMVEHGVDGDESRIRLTVRNGDSVCCGIVDADNRLVSEVSLDLRYSSFRQASQARKLRQYALGSA